MLLDHRALMDHQEQWDLLAGPVPGAWKDPQAPQGHRVCIAYLLMRPDDLFSSKTHKQDFFAHTIL